MKVLVASDAILEVILRIRRDLPTPQTSRKQTCYRTDQNGKLYAQHHIHGWKDQLGEDKSHRHNPPCAKNDVSLGRVHL